MLAGSQKRLHNADRSVVLLVLLATVAVATGDELSFRNDVMPVLAKAGCNAGICHGNKNGKGGFKLSLRGQDPDIDYLSLTRDSFARRANPLEPDRSLILLKPTGQVAHEGGLRFKTDSPEYAILRQWLASGTPNDAALAPRLQGIAIAPRERVLIEPEERVQLQVMASFSDGSTRDVTSLAVYEPINNAVKVLPRGLVQREAMGEATVLVRYLHCQEPVRLAFVPARRDFKWTQAPSRNYIDEYILAKLRTLRMNPSGLCSDQGFIRRAYLDLLGILPTADEARTFVADKRRDKRVSLVEQLLERPEYADFWALKWADLLRVEAHSLDQKGVQNFHHWIRQSIADNKPLDQFARELIM